MRDVLTGLCGNARHTNLQMAETNSRLGTEKGVRSNQPRTHIAIGTASGGTSGAYPPFQSYTLTRFFEMLQIVSKCRLPIWMLSAMVITTEAREVHSLMLIWVLLQ
jgi:hypothetical protein